MKNPSYENIALLVKFQDLSIGISYIITYPHRY